MRGPEHHTKNGHMISNILALDNLATRLPPPSPAPENPPPSQLLAPPSPENPHSVAAAIKDIRKAIQSAKTLHPTPGCVPGSGNDPWLPRGGDRGEPPLPAPPTSCPPTPPSPACSTPPPPPPVELHEETESELEEERVPTPEIMKKEDEDLDTDQVTQRSHSLLLPIKLCIIAPILVQLDLQFDKKKHFVLRVSCCCPGII